MLLTLLLGKKLIPKFPSLEHTKRKPRFFVKQTTPQWHESEVKHARYSACSHSAIERYLTVSQLFILNEYIEGDQNEPSKLTNPK